MTELSFDDFSQLSLRLRSPAPFNQMYLSFNPVSKANWRYKYFFETEAPAGCKIHQTTYKDNNYLPSEYVASLKDLETRNPIYYKIYVLGEFPTQRTAYLLGNGVFFEDNNTKHALGGASLDTNLYFAAKSALDQGMAYGFWIYDHIDFFERLEFCKLWDEEDGSLKAGIRFWDLILKKARKSADFESFNKVVLELQKLRDTFTTEVESQLENLEMGGASYRKVSKLAKPLTEDEIIKKISGTDKTKGSCASLALAYVANKMGLDVTDYRDGSSLNHFAADGANVYNCRCTLTYKILGFNSVRAIKTEGNKETVKSIGNALAKGIAKKGKAVVDMISTSEKNISNGLKTEGKSGTIENIKIDGKTSHSEERQKEREIADDDISDALANPLNVSDVKIDEKGRKSQKIIGEKATVIINPETGKIITIWKTGKRIREKYRK